MQAAFEPALSKENYRSGCNWLIYGTAGSLIDCFCAGSLWASPEQGETQGAALIDWFMILLGASLTDFFAGSLWAGSAQGELQGAPAPTTLLGGDQAETATFYNSRKIYQMNRRFNSVVNRQFAYFSVYSFWWDFRFLDNWSDGYWGSVTFWCGSGSADRYLWLWILIQFRIRLLSSVTLTMQALNLQS
jgi:hypothetical protein